MSVKVIKAPAGSGKTGIYLNLLPNADYGRIEIYVPTQGLAEELAEKLGKFPNPPSFRVIKGRDQLTTDSERMCKKHVRAAALAQKGYPVFPHLCSRYFKHHGESKCEHYDNCAYIRQFEGGEQIYFYTHASLRLSRSSLESKIPGLAIIDESFFQTCIETKIFPLSEFYDPNLGPRTQKLCRESMDALLQGKPVLKAIRDAGLAKSVPKALAENRSNDLLYICPSTDDAGQTAAIDEAPGYAGPQLLLEAISVELGFSRDESHAISIDPKKQSVRIHCRWPIKRFTHESGKQSDILILDANANPDLIRPWFPQFEFKSFAADRKAFVSQCVSSRCSTTSLIPGQNSDLNNRIRAEARLAQINDLIQRKAAGGGKRVLVVGPQAITGNPKQNIPALVSWPPNGALAHFGALRGIDSWKDFDIVIVIGRNEPPIKEVEAIARAIWWDSPEPLKFADDWSTDKRGYRMRQGLPASGVEVLIHPDARIQAVLEQLREGETTQAIDRLRLIHASQNKEVILLSNIPVDVEVDELSTFDDLTQGTRPERAWGRLKGVMLLAPAWLVKTFPDLWKSAGAAKKDLARGGQKVQITNINSISKMSLSKYEYRTSGQSRRSLAVSNRPVVETLIEITRLLGVPVMIREGYHESQNPELSSAIGSGSLEPMTASGVGWAENPKILEVSEKGAEAGPPDPGSFEKPSPFVPP